MFGWVYCIWNIYLQRKQGYWKYNDNATVYWSDSQGVYSFPNPPTKIFTCGATFFTASASKIPGIHWLYLALIPKMLILLKSPLPPPLSTLGSFWGCCFRVCYCCWSQSWVKRVFFKNTPVKHMKNDRKRDHKFRIAFSRKTPRQKMGVVFPNRTIT